MLIRLSFLLETPLDELVQKNRFYRTKDDAIKMAKELKQQLQEYESEIIQKAKDNPAILKFFNATKEMVDVIEQTGNNPIAIDQIESTLDK